MKKIIAFLVLILFVGALDCLSQGVTNSSISGVFTEYKTLTGNYDSDIDTLTGPVTTFEWISYDINGSNEDVLTATSSTLELETSLSLVGRRLKFVVHLTNTYGDFLDSDTSALSQAIIANSVAQVAPAPSINEVSGNMNVGSILLADYDYSDADDDPEGSSIFEWFKGATPATVSDPIGSSNSNSYIIKIEDEGKYFKYTVRPVAAAGNTTPGMLQTSSASGKVNERPRIDGAVTLTPTPVDAGNRITAGYTFDDPDGDADDSEFVWYKQTGGETSIIAGADTSYYETSTGDGGSIIYVEVTPRSLTGFPDTGTMKPSNNCTVNATGTPTIAGVCISGKRKVGEKLTGKISGWDYTEDMDADASIYKWYIGTSEIITPENEYELTSGDLDEIIIFEITPVAADGATGDPMQSAKLVDFAMATTQFSKDDIVTLVTDPVFNPVSGDFSPVTANISILSDQLRFLEEAALGTYTVKYTLDIDYDNSCTQRAWVDLTLGVSSVQWDAEDEYCYDEGVVDVEAYDLPVNAIPVSFSLPTNPDALISFNLVAPPYIAQVDITELGEGNKKDYIEFVYYDPALLAFFPSKWEFVIDSVGVGLYLSMVDSSFCENTDIKQISADSLYPLSATGTWSGGPAGMITSWDNDDAYIDPSAQKGGGDVNIYYELESGACSQQVSIPLTIYPKPLPRFMIADRCIQFEGDPTEFINITPDTLNVRSWAWDFGLGEGLSSLQDPLHIYQTGGVKSITLEAETFNGCVNDTVISDTLAKKPISDFLWKDDCFYEDEDLLLIDSSDVTESVDTAYWLINGITRIDVDIADPNAAYSKTLPPGPGVLSVDYYLKTFLPGCFDMASKDIYIRPVYTIKDKDYFEGFEGDSLGWVVDGDPANTWMLEAPAFIADLPSDSLWYTGIPDTLVVDYSVESPCFDFREVKRPMIKMDIIRAFDRGRDGAILQYKEGNKTWENIGGTDFGINWYKNSNISGKPGGSVLGWSPELEDDTLVQARQYLDELIGKKNVKFRVSYGSDGNAVETKGFAFDNIWIGERSRNVLVEHFTNYNSSEVVTADAEINSIINDISDDAMNIQYHTNYRAGDELYIDNTAVPSSRMLFYSLIRNPYTLFDGGTGLNFARRYDWTLVNATINDLRNRSLTDPLFKMRIDTLASRRFKVVIEPLQDIDASNMTLYIAIVAKEISSSSLSTSPTNGQTEFRNVLRRMIPDAGGLSLKKTWSATEGETTSIAYSREISMNFHTDSVEVIAFLQNNITKEVYQAATSGSLSVLSTSIGRVGFDEATFKIFPNPASSNLTFLFDREVYGNSGIKFYNNTGVLVKEMNLPAGIDRITVEDLSLPSGIYIVKLSLDSKPQGYRKLIITR